jgi:hypothetical protein
MAMMKRMTSGVALLGVAVLVQPAAAQQQVALPARDRPLTEQPAAVFTVGAADGESWEMFSGISAVAFDAADNLYVLDTQNTRVVAFDRSGRFLRQFGKRGSGPGELMAPIGMTVASDGNVVVNDIGNRAFVVFRTSGEHVRNVPYPMDGRMPMGGIQADPRGGVIARLNQRMGPESDGQNVASIVRQILDEKSAPVQIAQFEVTPPQVINQGESRRISIAMDPVFSARPSFGVLPGGGLAFHRGDDYAVAIHDGAGRHVRTLTRPITPRRVTKKDRDAYEERSRQAAASGNTGTRIMMTATGPGGGAPQVSVGGSGGGSGAPVGFDMQRQFADVMSVVTNVRTDPAGRVWVQRRHDDGRDAGPIDLTDANGRYIGTLPAQSLPGAVSASGLAVWIVRDDMGIERVSVRRLPDAWR